MEIGTRVLGAEHLDTLMNTGNLVSRYTSQGWWKEAEELGVQVVDVGKKEGTRS